MWRLAGEVARFLSIAVPLGMLYVFGRNAGWWF